jgi:amino acid transporter
MTEIVAMIASLIIASYFTFLHDKLGIFPMEAWQKTISGALLTTITWVVATYYTAPTSDETLRKFYRLIKPGGNGWDAVIEKANAEGDPIQKEQGQLPLELLCVVIGCLTVFGILFATGNWIYGNVGPASILTIISAAGAFFLFRAWANLRTE